MRSCRQSLHTVPSTGQTLENGWTGMHVSVERKMAGEECIFPFSHRKAWDESSLGKTEGLSIKEGKRGRPGCSGSQCYINQRQDLGTQWGYSKMQETDGLRPGEAAQGNRERQKGGRVVSLGDSITGNVPNAV